VLNIIVPVFDLGRSYGNVRSGNLFSKLRKNPVRIQYAMLVVFAMFLQNFIGCQPRLYDNDEGHLLFREYLLRFKCSISCHCCVICTCVFWYGDKIFVAIAARSSEMVRDGLPRHLL